jgi:hypothetical protein
MQSTRRELLAATLCHALLCITRAQAWASPLDPALQRWILRIGEIGRAVQTGGMTPLAWQQAMQQAYTAFPPEDWVAFIDLDGLLRGLEYPAEKLGAVKNVPWPEVAGFPADLRFGHKLFVYRKGSVTPPHVHNHMVSAHWVLRGALRTRTFDRVEDLESAILLQPTRDELSRPGALVSMSDERDNAHWFEGVSEEPAVSFDIPVVDVTPDKVYRHPAEAYNQIYLDPTVAPRADGRIEAPIIRFRESVRKFG